MLPDLSSLFSNFQSFFQDIFSFVSGLIQSLLSGFGIA